MKRPLIILVLSGMLALSACAAGDTAQTQQTADTAAATAAQQETTSETSSETTSETAAETTADTAETTTERPSGDYVHGEDGYFNLADEIPEFQMRMQDGGTCWLYAACASMETAYYKQNGRYMSLDPLELLDIIYINEKQDGFIPIKTTIAKEYGGWQWMVTETLTRGFGGLVIDSSVILDSTDRKAIQENIRSRGAVAVGIPDSEMKRLGVFGPYTTWNHPDADFFDHDVTIIGWDDHFPKEYFNTPADEDGAWITYNSNFSATKFYYISYSTPLEYAISHSVTDRYGEVLSYDAGNEQDRYITTQDSTKTANVFHKEGRLTAVGTYNDFDTQDITIEIYDSTFTDLLYSQENTLGYHGYHTIDLDTPADVTDYAIAVTYSKGAPVEGETIDYDMVDYTTFSESGESFVYIDGEWKDMHDSDIRSTLGIDYEPNNCCIKALCEKE